MRSASISPAPPRESKYDVKFCRVCLDDLGEKRKAHRIMPKGGGRCEEHFRHEQGLPQRTPEAEAFIIGWKQRKSICVSLEEESARPPARPPALTHQFWFLERRSP